MRRSERLAKLHSLLARVQDNARARRRELGLESIAPPALDDPDPSPAASPAPPRTLILPPDEALDWTSLLASDLGAREPVLEPPELLPDEPPGPAYADFASVDPPPALVEPAASVEPASSPGPVPAAFAAPAAESEAAEDVEPAPESELERAVQWAAARASMEPRALLQGAASELRERRSTAPPEEPARPSPAPPTAEPPLGAPIEPPPAPPPPPPAPLTEAAREDDGEGDRMERAFLDSARPHPAADRRRSYVIATIFAASVVIGALAYLRRDPPPSDPPSAAAPTTSANAVATVPAPSAAVATPTSPALPPLPSTPRSAAASSVIAVASVADPLPPPPRISRPTEMGLLYIDTREPSDVYVQGNRVGQSGQYIQVGCGMRFVRIAKSDPPPPGDSFPRWTGEGKAVLVPCGSLHRVDLR